MPDIEKVIKGLKVHKNIGCENSAGICPYLRIGCSKQLAEDALELIKEQQKEIERIKRLSNEMAKVALHE